MYSHCLVLSVLCDTASNNGDWLLSQTNDLALTKWLDGWLSVGDGAFTLLSEGFFVAAFYVLYRAARASRTAQALPP